MTSQTPTRRRPAALAAVVLAGLLLPGCSFWAPNTAIQPYAPADGLQAELGDVLVRNMLVVSEGDGEAGLLVGALVNRGQEDVTVELELGGTSAELEVPAGVSVAIGSETDRPDGEQSTIVSETVEIEEVSSPAGGSLDLTVTAPAGSTLLQVPVILPTGPYEGLVPGGGRESGSSETGSPSEDSEQDSADEDASEQESSEPEATEQESSQPERSGQATSGPGESEPDVLEPDPAEQS